MVGLKEVGWVLFSKLIVCVFINRGNDYFLVRFFMFEVRERENIVVVFSRVGEGKKCLEFEN